MKLDHLLQLEFSSFKLPYLLLSEGWIESLVEPPMYKHKEYYLCFDDDFDNDDDNDNGSLVMMMMMITEVLLTKMPNFCGFITSTNHNHLKYLFTHNYYHFHQ